MSVERIDARGLSCPQPVLLAQKAIAEGRTFFELLVDSDVSKENVLRLVKKSGMNAEVRNEGNDTVISIAK